MNWEGWGAVVIGVLIVIQAGQHHQESFRSSYFPCDRITPEL